MITKLTSLLLVSIFKNVLKDKILVSFVEFLDGLSSDEKDFSKDLKSYSNFISEFYEISNSQNLYEYVKNLIYTDENIISKGCTDCIKDNITLLETAKYELKLFDNLLSFDYETIKDLFLFKYSRMSELISHLPKFNCDNKINFDLDDIINSYSKKGYGIFSCYSAFKYTEECAINPVKYFDSVNFGDLKNYKYQQDILKNNTLAFLQGKQANNILLYGDRGCGKSSSVKALINEFQEYNLKIIQVYKEAFLKLPELYEKLRNLPLKFVIFADDISFDEDEKNFSSIKAILEGSLSNKPDNVIIYATTNRMHLVKESFSSREGNEVHYNDTIDEMVSLSDRFGIMLTFSSLTKYEYLDIVRQIASDCCITVDEKLNLKACEFAMQKGIMTPRIAREFIIDFISNN